MRKHTKLFITALLTFGMVLSLTGCGTSAGATSEQSSAGSASESASSESAGSASDTAASDNSDIVIGFSQDTNDIEWTQKMKDDITQACEDAGVQLTATASGGSGEKQVANIEDLITLGVDAIVMHTYHADVVTNAVQNAMDAGIPVIVLASEIPGVDVTSLITVDSTMAGETCGEYLAEKFPDGAKIVELDGKEGSKVNTARGEGFHNIIDQDDKYEVLSCISANYERSKALTIMEDQLHVYGDEIDAVYCHNDDMALGAIQAIEDAGYEANVDDGIFVISPADGIYEEVLTDIQEGKMVSGYFPTFGAEGVETAIAAVKGEEVEKTIYIDTILIDQENVSEYL